MHTSSLRVLTAACVLAIAGGAAQAGTLAHHDFVSGEFEVVDQPDIRTNERYGARFQASSYPVTITHVRVFLGENGAGTAGGDCASFGLAVYDDPAGDPEPGTALFDSEDTELLVELKEATALQEIPLASFGTGPIVANGPFRVVLIGVDAQCLLADPFGQAKGYPRFYTDAAITPGVNFAQRRNCTTQLECNALGGAKFVWGLVEDTFPNAGDFIMEVVTEGGDEPECLKADDCDDFNDCTTDTCNGDNLCVFSFINGCGEPDPEPDLGPEPVADEAPEVVEVVPDAVPDAAPEPIPDVAPDAVSDAAPDPVPDIAPDAAPEVAPDAGPDPTPDAAPSDLGPGDTAAPDVSPQALRIDSISPSVGPDDQPTTVTITGEGFAAGAVVRLGPTVLGEVAPNGPQRLSAVVPAGLTPGVYSLFVQQGAESAELPDAFEVRRSSGGGCGGAPAGPTPWLLVLLPLLALRATARR